LNSTHRQTLSEDPSEDRQRTRQRRRQLCHYNLMPPRDPDGPPPFLGTWRRVYITILIYLGALIAGFYLFTWAYR